MKTKFPTFLALVFTALGLQCATASVIGYASTNGGQYNSVGPIFESPEYEGDKFTVTISGWLDSIAAPLSRFPFDNTPARGNITLWSDNNGAVGDLIFSAPVSTTNPPTSSYSLLPPFTIVSVPPNTVFLTAGTNYWLTFSETDGNSGLGCYSSVFQSSLESVYFYQGTIHYDTLQPMVAIIRLNPLSLDSSASTNLVSLSATALLQGAPSGAGTSIPAPTHYPVNTKRILSWLALDEYQAGVYTRSNFPAGAQLAIIGSTFEVVDKNKKPIVDVSNILTSRFGSNEILDEKEALNGKFQGRIQVRRRLFNMDYNDSNINGGVGVNFNLSGIMTSTVSTMPDKGTVSSEVTVDKLSSATGEGRLRGVPFVITGGFTASARSTLDNE